MKEEIKLMWSDPRFQVLINVLHLLEGDRIWGGMDWVYHPIPSFKYLPVRDQVRQALDAVKAEYGVVE
jgi:hypothetical protein